MDTVLYDYWRSSASYRLRIALNLAGIHHRAVSVDLAAKENLSAEHLARNPQGFVPVLEIDGHQLTQSMAILTYLNETRTLGLLPMEPAARAQMEALAQSIAIDIHPVCNLQVAVKAAELAGRDAAKVDWMVRFIRPGLVAFETLLGAYDQSPFCCGDRPMLPDIVLIPQVYNAQRWGVDIADLARIGSAVRACETHPAFAAAYPDSVRPE